MLHLYLSISCKSSPTLPAALRALTLHVAMAMSSLPRSLEFSVGTRQKQQNDMRPTKININLCSLAVWSAFTQGMLHSFFMRIARLTARMRWLIWFYTVIQWADKHGFHSPFFFLYRRKKSISSTYYVLYHLTTF